MNQNKCQKATHDNMNIITICFDKKCQGQRVCCSICLNEFHKDHNSQQVDLEYLQNFVYTQSQRPIVLSPMVDYALSILTQVQKYIDDLSKLVKQEMDRLNSANLNKLSKDVTNKHNIQKDKIQILANEVWNQLAQDILSYVEVKNNRIIETNSFLNNEGKVNFGMMTQFQMTLKLIEDQMILINQEHDLNTITESSILKGHKDLVHGVDVCEQRRLLASGSSDETVKVWNLEDNTQLRTYSHSGAVYDVKFSEEGNMLAFCGAGDYSIMLIDINDLEKENILSQFHGHEGIVWRLVFSKDSKYVISGSDDTTLRVWDISKKEQNLKLCSESQVRSVAISHENTYLTSNSMDGKIRIWNFQTQGLLCSHPAHSNGAGLSFSNDPEILVSSGYDGIIKLWSLIQLNKKTLSLIKTFKVANNCIWSVLFSSDCSFIISISNKDSQILILDSQTGKELKRFKSNQTQIFLKIVGVAVSKSSNLIAYGENNSIVIWRKKL